MIKILGSKFLKTLPIPYLMSCILGCSQERPWKEPNVNHSSAAEKIKIVQEPAWTGLILPSQTIKLENIQQVRDYLKEISDTNNGVKLRISLLDDNSGDMKISCPIDILCDENYAYRAYEGNVPNLRLYVSFKPRISKDLSAASILDNFKYLSYTIYFPVLSQGKWRLSSNMDSLLEKGSQNIIWRQKENGKLQLTIVGKIDKIWALLDDPKCKIADAPSPPGCFATVPADISYEIIIDRELENLISLDCTDPKNHPRCG